MMYWLRWFWSLICFVQVFLRVLIARFICPTNYDVFEWSQVFAQERAADYMLRAAAKLGKRDPRLPGGRYSIKKGRKQLAGMRAIASIAKQHSKVVRAYPTWQKPLPTDLLKRLQAARQREQAAA